jgi:anti-sigma B factor antagonist
MKIIVSTIGTWRTMALQGKFTVKNIPLIRKYFESAEQFPLPGIMIDMSGVTQLDSSAISMLVNFQRRILQKNGLFVLVGMSNDITEIFSIVGIDKIFSICKNNEEFMVKYVHPAG